MFGSLTIKMNDTCKQMTKFIMCTILVISAFPFIGLAAIFSIFMDIPHIKIELGSDNIVESVHFNMKRTQKNDEESESDTESGYDAEEEDNESETSVEEEEQFVRLSKGLSKYLFDENDNVITTFTVLREKMDREIEEKGPFDGKGGIIFYPELWRFLGLADDEKLTVDRLWKLLKNEYVELEKVEEKEVTVKEEKTITGRVGGFEYNFPATPVRSRSLTPPCAPQRKNRLDTGVLIDKLRASSESNDADITRDLSESFEQATGVQTPSECPPSSS